MPRVYKRSAPSSSSKSWTTSKKYGVRQDASQSVTVSTSSINPAIKRYVQRVLANRVERKQKDVQIGPQNVSNIIDNTRVQNLCAAIQQGTTQSTRIGNKVNIKKCTVKFTFTLSPIAGIITNPLPTYVDIYIFKTKYQNNFDGAPTATDMQVFLQDDSTSVQYLGNPLDGMRNLNGDVFTPCIQKRICLYNQNSSVATYAATSSINPNRYFKFDVTKYLKKEWSFDDGTSSCTNDNLYMAVGTTQTDGVSTGVSITGSYYAIVETEYEDP